MRKTSKCAGGGDIAPIPESSPDLFGWDGLSSCMLSHSAPSCWHECENSGASSRGILNEWPCPADSILPDTSFRPLPNRRSKREWLVWEGLGREGEANRGESLRHKTQGTGHQLQAHALQLLARSLAPPLIRLQLCPPIFPALPFASVSFF